MVWLPSGEKHWSKWVSSFLTAHQNVEDMFIRFNSIHKRDGQILRLMLAVYANSARVITNVW